MKTISSIALAALIVAFAPNDLLTGRWESKPSEKGNVTGVVFSPDHTFEGYINKKPFVSGVYRLNPADSVFTFTDNGCNGVEGKYKLVLFSNGDSLRFKPIEDSCDDRRGGMQRLTLGRVKAQ